MSDLPCTTDGLVAYHREHAEGVDPDLLERAIPAAIDALYEARNAGKVMHQAGAEVAVTVLRTVGFAVAEGEPALIARLLMAAVDEWFPATPAGVEWPYVAALRDRLLAAGYTVPESDTSFDDEFPRGGS